MKTSLAVTVLLVAVCLCTLQAQTDEPERGESRQTADTSQVEQELIDTLAEAFDQALNRYATDPHAEPDAAIRINEKLYDAQLQSTDEKREAIESYLSRSKRVEAIATDKLQEGWGTSTAMLEAKASRLTAMRDLANCQ